MGIFDLFKKRKKQKKKKKPPMKIEEVRKETPKAEPVKKVIPKKKTGEAYKILKEPHISEKATQLSDERKYTFKVYPRANKIQIKKAVSDLYGVKVKDVKIINIKAKTRMLRGLEGTKAGYKKAIITLEEGYKIELLPH